MNTRHFLISTTTCICILLFSAKSLAFDLIAHRGASGFLPEHSKEALVLAFMQGADYIEQDLVLSRDNELIVLHDIHLENVTNVEVLYPQRKRKDGRWYAIDFTLDELRSLSLHERTNSDGKLVFANRYQGAAHFTVSTFAEHVELVSELNRQLNKNVGLYPEIKSPAWHLEEGKDIASLLVDELNRLSLNSKDARIFVQSFEPESLKRLKFELGAKTKLVQLIADNSWGESLTDYNALQTSEGLQNIASYADGIGPWLPQVYDFKSQQPTALIKRAKVQGLLIHPYTFRTDVIDKPEQAFEALKSLAVDGVFSDQIMPYMLK
uniref:glycerophosphodiester phosphodiesterase n=1 Tax=Ningiella ruwaisensis TaxID=2364274 RepID=UPI00109FCF21|nr:glycerophosphodiester phosphodiesterase [Ningiella ruwaisensis]